MGFHKEMDRMGETPKGFMTFERKETFRHETFRHGDERTRMSTTTRTPDFSGALSGDVPAFSEATSPFDARQKELDCARQFNFELPEDLVMAVELFENSIARLSGTRKSAILMFNEESGTYTCLNDQKYPDQRPRELTLISDGFLQDMLNSTEVIHTYLYSPHSLIGIVAVADKVDSTPFDARDEITLELVARYLSTKVLGFQALKESLSLPYVQNVVLEISNRLISAIDQETIVSGSLESLGNRLEIDVCQYVTLDPETGEGQVLYESQDGQVKSFSHVGQKEKRKVVKEFASLVSLFSSVGRRNPYLRLNGQSLGDKALSDLFGVPGIQSALILPVTDPNTGKTLGVLNLFKTLPGVISNDTLEISKAVVVLMSMALSRATALEKALVMASSDELTGLTNRRGFYERFEVEIERSRRNPTSLCVAMIDVDHFKLLNDTFGHLNGDRVLQEMAKLLLQNVRKSDVVCRFGGEEFALLLPDTTLKSAMELLDRIRRKIQRHRTRGIHGEFLKVTLSAGVTLVQTHQSLVRPIREVISEAMSDADEQLYLAKEGGRNQVRGAGVPQTTQTQLTFQP